MTTVEIADTVIHLAREGRVPSEHVYARASTYPHECIGWIAHSGNQEWLAFHWKAPGGAHTVELGPFRNRGNAKAAVRLAAKA